MMKIQLIDQVSDEASIHLMAENLTQLMRKEILEKDSSVLKSLGKV